MNKELQTRRKRYLLGIHLGRRFLFRKMIDDTDYKRLETRFAENYRPPVRYRTAMLDSHPLIGRRRKK